VQVKTRDAQQPAFDLRRLVGGIVVQDEVHIEFLRSSTARDLGIWVHRTLTPGHCGAMTHIHAGRPSPIIFSTWSSEMVLGAPR